MADAQASGACYGNIVWVQVPSPASIFLKRIICGSVGTGRRARLRILWWVHRVGSSPIFRSLFFYPFVIPKSQAITCMLIHKNAATPRSQPIAFTISSILHHILFILGLAREQNIAAVDKSHVTVFVQISFHSRPPCVNLFAFFYGLNLNRGGVHMFVQIQPPDIPGNLLSFFRGNTDPAKYIML